MYVGQQKTKNLNNNYLGSGIYITRAINHYGKSNFKREILKFCQSKKQLNEQEIYWIKELNSHISCGGYNMTWGGQGGGMIGKKHSEKTIKKMRKSKMGKQFALGCHISEDTKKKIKETKKLNLYNPTRKTCEKMSRLLIEEYVGFEEVLELY
jgi:group I intron endonuclease